ncbi:MAG: phage antirepressor KilAC domain-containing protein, partial [Pseudomonadota bacterium]
MSHPPLPKDCYDVETVSHLLSISVVELYKFLREKDWLHNKAFKNDKRHNLPKDWTKKTGYLTTQERG